MPAAAESAAEVLTLQEIAGLAGVSPETVRGWVASGKLYAFRAGPRLWRVPRWAWTRFLEECNDGPVETADAQRERERRRDDATRRLDARLGPARRNG